MFNLKLNVKRFLTLPMNGGKQYIKYESMGMDKEGVIGSSAYSDTDCGCIKGNFARSSNVMEKLYGKSYIDNVLINERIGQAEFCQYNMFHLHKQDRQLCKILDRAEQILMDDKKPQHAKLFLIRALRMFKYIPTNTEAPIKVESYV
jgi:hypothetical protein